MIKVMQMVRKWQKLARPRRSYTALDSDHITPPTFCLPSWDSRRFTHKPLDSSFTSSIPDIPEGSLAVYVGRDKRRYVISSQYLNHPLLKSLMERSEKGCDEEQQEGLSVPCEVVLFEHLLWMLKSNDEFGSRQIDSVDELVEFYACA